MRYPTLLAAFTAVTSLPGAAVAATTLDDFTTTQRVQDLPDPAGTFPTTSTDGNRTLTASAVALGTDTEDVGDVVMKSDVGRLSYSSAFNIGGEGNADYDVSATGDFGLARSFDVDFISTDNPYQLSVGVEDGDGNASEVTKSVSAADNGMQLRYVVSSFDDSVDFGNLSTLSLNFDSAGEAEVDTAIDTFSVSPIPVPAGGVLLVGGLAGLGAVRRLKT